MNKKDGWNHNNDQPKETKHRKKNDQDTNTRKEEERDLQYAKQLLRTIMANYPFTAELNQVSTLTYFIFLHIFIFSYSVLSSSFLFLLSFAGDGVWKTT